MTNFTAIERNGETIWMHESRRVWIVKYDATIDRNEFFQGYRAVGSVKPGRQPWSVDNRRIGTERGFQTLSLAMQAAA